MRRTKVLRDEGVTTHLGDSLFLCDRPMVSKQSLFGAIGQLAQLDELVTGPDVEGRESYQRTTAAPQVSPAPKPQRSTCWPGLRAPARSASINATGILAAQVLP